jgi:hypothetical protein
VKNVVTLNKRYVIKGRDSSRQINTCSWELSTCLLVGCYTFVSSRNAAGSIPDYVIGFFN